MALDERWIIFDSVITVFALGGFGRNSTPRESLQGNDYRPFGEANGRSSVSWEQNSRRGGRGSDKKRTLRHGSLEEGGGGVR